MAGWRSRKGQGYAPDINRQRALTERRAQLAHQREADIEQLARVRRRLDQTTAGLGRLRNRELRTQLQADHDLRLQGLARLDDQLHQLDTELAALPSPQQVADIDAQYRELTSLSIYAHVFEQDDQAAAELTAAAVYGS